MCHEGKAVPYNQEEVHPISLISGEVEKLTSMFIICRF